jgi:hypothetical protein
MLFGLAALLSVYGGASPAQAAPASSASSNEQTRRVVFMVEE